LFPKNHNNGSDISKEIDCIQKIMRQHKEFGTNLNNKCKIFLVSDRNETLESLKEWVPQNTNCTALVANHEADTQGLFEEHGPFAMRGFFQDLALAAHANGGFIGAINQRSSSADLFHELYEYNHYDLYHKKEENKVTVPIIQCNVPKHK
jgi:hypothetical protein